MQNTSQISVIGAGVMGVGVAHALAQTGHQVLLLDVTDAILEKAKEQIQNSIRFQTLFQKNGADQKSPDLPDLLDRITFSTDYTMLENTDFVIENVPEKWSLKQNIYQKIDAICPPKTVFAANTSAIPITRIAAATQRPSQVLGIHFMNPVPMKKTVEMIRGYHTSEQTLAIAQSLLTKMGKQWILVNDSPGFVSNRILMLTVNEAIFCLQDDVAAAADIDQIFKACFGHKMGPLETADLIGLDTILLSIEVLYESFRDSKYRPCPLLQKMVDAGLLGRKSGQGFYTYHSGGLEKC
ncbi:3-hydroxyacyl-CoA dehydrogenase NAD-binding domain-containing protein [Oscillatoria sp. CS-180]|uniref:3-hydroxyacyl-CoA dehydrogenase family protein n=1 Tax=Oscillatoria sp. CS-180 TaxID=3021720 RepID=UPI00232A85E5|nr:3-hydroxyacyl-CoA dehydrogenase NAD-binding domain-containing protein [Oscillatoria sp. CS-180]MDB9527424.1 3-hydroxyacyl-CoA dehydrogenase NAD-binding domain-containing protein [Oscillatoria sp. CS-180]